MMRTTKTWTNGTICERSERRVVVEEKEIKEEGKEKEKEIKEPTRMCDSFDNQIMSNCETVNSRDTNNRREDTYIRMAGREMFNKIIQNPFLLGNDYVRDIENQDQYLRGPQGDASLPSKTLH
jgi:hypothetical protein